MKSFPFLAFAVLTAGFRPGQSSAADPATASLVEEARRLCTYAPVDFPRAAELLRRAEAAGDADATANLGLLYAGGEGVPYDPERARELYRAGAEASREWFLPEAERGSLNAMQALAVSYAICHL